jgi:hypothetical protein
MTTFTKFEDENGDFEYMAGKLENEYDCVDSGLVFEVEPLRFDTKALNLFGQLRRALGHTAVPRFADPQAFGSESISVEDYEAAQIAAAWSAVRDTGDGDGEDGWGVTIVMPSFARKIYRAEELPVQALVHTNSFLELRLEPLSRTDRIESYSVDLRWSSESYSWNRRRPHLCARSMAELHEWASGTDEYRRTAAAHVLMAFAAAVEREDEDDVRPGDWRRRVHHSMVVSAIETEDDGVPLLPVKTVPEYCLWLRQEASHVSAPGGR